MPDPSTQRLILEAAVARLSAISVANGFRTDAGEDVYHGRLKLEEVVRTRLCVYSPKEVAQEPRGRNRVEVTMQLVVEAQVSGSGPLVEDVAADVQQAMEDPLDRGFDGLATQGIRYAERTTSYRLEHEPAAQVYLTYHVTYHRKYGGPADRA